MNSIGISEFMGSTHSKDEWIAFCRELVIVEEDTFPAYENGAYAIFCKAVENGFFDAPASTKYHGASRGGLVKHSLLVTKCAIELMSLWGLETTGLYAREAILAAFFHDICKTQLYKEQQLWRKDCNGKWESYPGYIINDELIQIGHGCESLRMIERFYKFTNEGWAQAVNWHMGMPEEWTVKQQFMKACEKYPEVLVLCTADMRAVTNYKM